MVFVVEHWTTDILPTKKVTGAIPFTCSASDNHENKNQPTIDMLSHEYFDP